MTSAQERAITLSLNILHVGFFECPRHYYEYFIDNDDWALLMAAAALNAVNRPPQEVALGVLYNAVMRKGFFEGMTDFKPPAHFCSFLRDKATAGKGIAVLEPCREGQRDCPYATFENLSKAASSSDE